MKVFSYNHWNNRNSLLSLYLVYVPEKKIEPGYAYNAWLS